MSHVNLAHFHYGNKKNAKTLLYLLFWSETLISLIFECFLRKLKQCKHQTSFEIGELRSSKLFCCKNKTFCIQKFLDNTQQCFAVTLHLSHPYMAIFWIFNEGEGDRIKSRLYLKQKRFQKVAWIQFHHLQWKLKLWAENFAWGEKAKHYWV